jgi:hypothetical protein
VRYGVTLGYSVSRFAVGQLSEVPEAGGSPRVSVAGSHRQAYKDVFTASLGEPFASGAVPHRCGKRYIKIRGSLLRQREFLLRNGTNGGQALIGLAHLQGPIGDPQPAGGALQITAFFP